MREIKFRAWNTDYRKPIMESFTLKEEVKLKYLHDKNIMQFTGLKDKNGKEIFEGDIFVTPEEQFVWVVVFENGCYKIECSDLMATIDLFRFADHSVVFGNIYENPELITAEPEEEKFSKGNVVKHKDAAYSEEFTIVRIEDEGHILIQGPESKYKAPFYTDIEKLIKVN